MKLDEIIIATIHYSMDLANTASGLIQLLIQIIADIDYLSREPQNEMEKQIQKEVMKIENTMATYIDDFSEIFEDMGYNNPHAHSRIFIGALDGLGLQLSLSPKPDKKMMEQLTQSLIALFTRR